MRKIISSSISKPGHRINEDIASVSKNSAWVLDGATGLNNKNLIAEDSDAKWFVEKWNAYLIQHVDDIEISLPEILRNGIQQISNAYFSSVDAKKITALDLPSAGISLVRLNGGILEYFILGDCTLHFKKDNVVTAYKIDDLEDLDNMAIAELKHLLEKGLSKEQAMEQIKPLLIRNRKLKNKPGGYWILGFDECAVDNGLTGRVDINSGDELLLMTDGFSAICNKYNVRTIDSIFNNIEFETLEDIYTLIRTTEEEDPDIMKYPRFKLSDDASCVYLRLE